MQPVLYVSFGMGKAGSTLAFNLARELLVAAGSPQPALRSPGTRPDNFVATLTWEVLGWVREEAEAAATTLAVKTHRRPFLAVRRALAAGWLTGHAVCRDPRDIALSMVDATARGLGWGQYGGTGFARPEDALPVIRNHAKRFEAWATLPGILPFDYERVAFDTEAVAARIAAQLGLDVDLPAVVRAAKAHTKQFSIGRSRRWQAEMDPALAAEIGAEFAAFITTWCG